MNAGTSPRTLKTAIVIGPGEASSSARVRMLVRAATPNLDIRVTKPPIAKKPSKNRKGGQKASESSSSGLVADSKPPAAPAMANEPRTMLIKALLRPKRGTKAETIATNVRKRAPLIICQGVLNSTLQGASQKASSEIPR